MTTISNASSLDLWEDLKYCNFSAFFEKNYIFHENLLLKDDITEEV